MWSVLIAVAVAAAVQAASASAAGSSSAACALPVVQLGPLASHRLCVNASTLERLEVGDAALLSELRAVAGAPATRVVGGKGFFRVPCREVAEGLDDAAWSSRGRSAVVANAVPIPTKPTQQALFNAYVEELEIMDLVNMDRNLSDTATFFTRYYKSESGRQAAQFLYEQVTKLAGNSVATVVTGLWQSDDWDQPSVTARILGKGKVAGRVVLGAHIDSIGACSTCESPGADDDGSGSATVFAVYKALLQSQWMPERDIEFHWYSAEEGGLRGSNEIASAYKDIDVDVISMLQFDMTMFGSDTEPIGLIEDYVNPELTSFVKTLLDTYTRLPVQASRCGYACSDHASWTKYGYRSSFPFERPFGSHNPHIHTGDDVYKYLNPKRGYEYAKLGLAYLLEMDAAPATSQ